MAAFRILLIVLLVGVAAYTVPVVARDGLNFMPWYLQDIAAGRWPGQFNVDFTAMLILGGVWLAWRHGFTLAGIVLGALVTVLGAPWLCANVLYLSFRPGATVASVLAGESAA